MAETVPLDQLNVAMIVRNEAAQLTEALASVNGLAGRVLVLDTGSTDDTIERARAQGAEVFSRPDFPGFGPAKQEILDQCSSEWVLFLDADERVTPELATAIRNTVVADDRSFAGWRVRRRNHVLGRRMRSMGLDRDQPLRLFRRSRARVSDTLVHEVVEVDGGVGELQGRLDHHTMTSIDAYLKKIDLYTTLELEQNPRPLRVWHLVTIWPGTFLKWYLARGGWRDGVPGLVWAGLTATGRFIRDFKVWIAHQPRHED